MVKVKGSFIGVREVSACKKETGLGGCPKVPQVIGYEIVGNIDLIEEKKIITLNYQEMIKDCR